MALSPTENGIRYKSAAAARLADLPVTTLRVWERRYSVVAPRKTQSGQRLYGPDDIHRLLLIKGLVAGGHAIGTIARLPTPDLEALAVELRPEPDRSFGLTAINPVRIGVIGQALPARVEAWLMNRPDPAAGMELRCRFSSIAEAAEQSAGAEQLDLLILQTNSLRLAEAQSILALMRGWKCARTIVLYGFGTGGAVRALQSFGATLRRGPLIGLDLDALIGAAPARPADPAQNAPAAPMPPRYSDAVLDQVAAVRTSISCECPRHVASLLAQLTAFEHYSRECLTGNSDDFALHMELGRTAGRARELFERALEQLAAAHGFTPLLSPPADTRQQDAPST